MPTKRTSKVAAAAKKVMSQGKSLTRKAGTTARTLKIKATGTASAAGRKVKKAVKKAKPSAAVRQAGRLGRAVGSMIGQAIGTVEKAVNGVIKK